MEEDLTNLGNPLNSRDDLETRNQPHVTLLPPESQADDLFDDSHTGALWRDSALEPATRRREVPRRTPADRARR